MVSKSGSQKRKVRQENELKAISKKCRKINNFFGVQRDEANDVIPPAAATPLQQPASLEVPSQSSAGRHPEVAANPLQTLQEQSDAGSSSSLRPGETPSSSLHPCETPSSSLHPCETPSSSLHPCETPSSSLHPCETPSSSLHPCETPSSSLHPCETPSSSLHPCETPSSSLHPCETPSSSLHPGKTPSSLLRPGEPASSSPLRPGEAASSSLCPRKAPSFALRRAKGFSASLRPGAISQMFPPISEPGPRTSSLRPDEGTPSSPLTSSHDTPPSHSSTLVDSRDIFVTPTASSASSVTITCSPVSLATPRSLGNQCLDRQLTTPSTVSQAANESPSVASSIAIDSPSSTAADVSDIGLYIDRCEKLTDELKYKFITERPPLPEKLCSISVQKGSCNVKTLSFQRSWLKEYNWLRYSVAKKGGFCVYCVLFAKKTPRIEKFGVLVAEPLAAKHLSKAKGQKDGYLTLHPANDYHNNAVIAAENLIETYLNPELRIDNRLDGDIVIFDRNKGVLKSIIACAIWCGQQNTAFRGHRDDETSTALNRGKFSAMIHFRAQTDPPLKHHLETAKKNARYCSKTIQNQLISIIGEVIKDKLLESVRQGSVFSVMADEVTDPHSNKEIMAVCVRFLETKNGVLCPKEAFIEFCEPPRATGEALSETILHVLQRNKLPIQNLVGQSYDTTACMSSGNKGVQGRIKQSAPMAVYSPCKSHLLNLSIASVSKIQTIRNVIDVVNSTFLYIDNSPKRQKLWLKVIADAPGSARKLLGLCKTRWVERHRSLDRFFDMYPYIVVFLDATVNPHLHDQFGTDWNWDKDSRIKAQGLLSSLENFVNLAAFVVLRSALQPLADIACKLQLRTLDVCKAYSEIDKVTSEILTMRNNIDANYDAWYKDALDIAGKIGAVEAVPRTNKRQTQRDNVPHTTPKEYYRISIAIPFLEHLSNELGTRFSDQNRQAISNILRLVPKVLVSGHHANADELVGVYESILPQASALRCELARWNGLWLQSSALGNDSPDSLVETINRTSSERFPNIHSLLVVGCSLPVGSCEAERAFSALRRTKNYLRSSMTEERLSNLALMVIHNDIELDTDEIADRFIRAHPRRLFDASLLDRD